jgi:hypothetical protein
MRNKNRILKIGASGGGGRAIGALRLWTSGALRLFRLLCLLAQLLLDLLQADAVAEVARGVSHGKLVWDKGA